MLDLSRPSFENVLHIGDQIELLLLGGRNCRPVVVDDAARPVADAVSLGRIDQVRNLQELVDVRGVRAVVPLRGHH